MMKTKHSIFGILSVMLMCNLAVFRRAAADPLPFVEAAKLLPSDGAANNNFGFSVAVSGDTAMALQAISSAIQSR